MRRLVLDLDYLLADFCNEGDGAFARLSTQIESYRQLGFEVVLTSSAGMIECNGNVGKASGHVTYEIVQVIRDLGLEYDELVVGKPPIGPMGLVLDDKAVTPEEFLETEYEEISRLLDDA